jgi:hypothetical protein
MAYGNTANDDDHKAVAKETKSANDNPEELHTSSSEYCWNKDVKTRPAVRQPKGECDPGSELTCSCLRRTFLDPTEEMPMATMDSNRKTMEEFIRKHYKTSAFNTCKRQHWPVTAGPPMRIHTPDNAVPKYCRKPTRVPPHFMKEVRAGLEANVKKEVLERVHVGGGGADTWRSRMVIQPKKNGEARRTVDMARLSKGVKHESHHTRLMLRSPSLSQLVS